MGKLRDLVEIKKDSFFNGAVQAEWFYDKDRRKSVAESYIFHGPKYYGVDTKDIASKNHKLCDTVSFTKTIYRKIYEDIDTSRFALTIAGYGAGKSHLSLALASLLSGEDKDIQEKVLENLKNADKDEYEYIKERCKDKNLVLVLNGINDFNLNKEILRVAKESLKLHGINDEIFSDMTMAYKTARTFLNTSYEYLSDLYLNEAKKISKYRNYTKDILKEILLKNIEEYDVYAIVNTVYKKQTGNDININEGISAGIVLNRLHKRYVIEQKKFRSIIIIFDEFGRYLEFASTQPGIAGETAIQQIFESVQNASPTMLFIGFIQSDLNAYMNRVNNDNIARYVSRYQSSDKFYLSSNLETVLASLIKKKKNSEKIISNIFDNTLYSFSNISQKNITRWIPELNNKYVWHNENMYKQVILKGCYPIHPLTISTLSTLSSYMQQRSTLTFLSDIFNEYMDDELSEKIPFIYPVALIESPLFEELINAEERGRVPGESCTQYKDIITTNEEVLNNNDKLVLSAILIMNISKFKIYDKNDALVAFEMISGKSQEVIISTLDNLENKLGIIYYDSRINRYNFMTEGNSKIDYLKVFSKKKKIVNTKDIISNIPDDIRKELKLGIIEQTDFGRRNYIVTNEWSFTKEILDINDFTLEMTKSLIEKIKKQVHPDENRGRFIYLYCNQKSYYKINDIVNILKEVDYENVPILFGLINDTNGYLEEALINLRIINLFSTSERQAFDKYLKQAILDENKKFIRAYTECAKQKQYITKEGVRVADSFTQKEIVNKFENIFTKTVPFAIDGFEKKITPKSRKYFNTIVECLLSGKLEDVVEYNNLAIDIKNRINSILSVDSEKGWKVFYSGNVISKPLHPVVNEIYEEIEKLLKSGEKILIGTLIGKYTKAPYGLNIYSASLLVVYTIAVNRDNIQVYKASSKSRVLDIISCFNDEKKEKFNDFIKYSIKYSEETEKDKILQLIEKIEKNRNVAIDQASEFFDEISKVNILDVTQELRGRYYNCESTLKIATDKNKEINNKLIEAKTSLSKLNTNPFLIRNIIGICNNISDGVIPGSTYRYSITQVKVAKELKEESIDKFRNIILKFAEKCSLDNVNQIDTMYKNTIKQLPTLGAVELTSLVNDSYTIFKQRIKKKEESIKIIKEIESELSEIKINIELIRDIEKCEDILNKWLEKKNQLEQLGSVEISKVYVDIENLISKITIIKDNTKNILNNIQELILTVDNIDDLETLIEKINVLNNKPMLDNAKEKIQEVNSILIEIFKSMQQYKYRKYTVEEVEDLAESLYKKYKAFEAIALLINRVKENLINKFNEDNTKWKVKFIDSHTELDGISIDRLKSILRDAQINKEYLSQENKCALKDLENRINNILSRYKIENIISIFKELDEEDKVQCIESLKIYI